jgi:hypothetical protein
MPSCPDCDRELGAPIAVKFKPTSRREFYACTCGDAGLQVGERRRDFDLEDAEAEESWGAILWDLGVGVPEDHPFAAVKAA